MFIRKIKCLLQICYEYLYSILNIKHNFALSYTNFKKFIFNVQLNVHQFGNALLNLFNLFNSLEILLSNKIQFYYYNNLVK